MSITEREFWTACHGMVAGAVYLLAFSGGFAGLWNLRKWAVTDEGMRERIRLLLTVFWTMAIMCWVTVISGTYIVYPWYRDKISDSPRSKLLADPSTAGWHTFGMEWKEHVAWIAPMLTTAVLAIVLHYRETLAEREDLRRATMVLYVLAFLAAAVAGIFGAFITKVQPIL